ncbi:MAG: PhoH-like protein [Candidatus Hydrogenedentota bacterium]
MRIVDRGAKVVVMGDDEHATFVGRLLDEMLAAVRKGHTPTLADLRYAMGEARKSQSDDLAEIFGDAPEGLLRREIRIKPRTRGQVRYLEAIQTHTITVGIGPAGTGKTYLAMAAAVSALLNKEVNRLILTRPAVEAGENLGFLPGDLVQKVNPYLRPLYDALYSMVDIEKARRMVEREMIEVAPLAFMRGRTLDHSFLILDEAQNTTGEQMKMFLTRLGEGSRAVITGDITQIDLPKARKSGLKEAERILHNVPGIALIRLHRSDVVRHPLVQSIIEAYDRDEASQEGLDSAQPSVEFKQ